MGISRKQEQSFTNWDYVLGSEDRPTMKAK
jgi:hypothetical protein